MRKVINFPDWLKPEHFPIVGVDPGGTTGLACMRADQRPDGLWNMSVEFAKPVWPDQASVILDFLNGASTILVEDWMLYPFKSASLGWNRMVGPQVIGFVRGYLVIWERLNSLYFITPAANKQITDAFLTQKYAAWVPRNRHSRDAFRVINAWLLKKGVK